MKYTDLIFDLYGTLVDIHTEEDDLVWEKTALFFGYYGAHYTPDELKTDFLAQMGARKAAAGQSYECFPDIPVEQVMAQLFRQKGICQQAESFGVQAAQLFRITSTEYIRLYSGVKDALETLRQKGFRLWLLSNAQQVFTAYELRHLQLGQEFDGVYLSSDYGCRKPDLRFFRALLEEQKLDPKDCLMIGNDLDTDIAGAKAAGMDTLYLHTNLTPPEQRCADPMRHPAVADCHYEVEGCDWTALATLLGTWSEEG